MHGLLPHRKGEDRLTAVESFAQVGDNAGADEIDQTRNERFGMNAEIVAVSERFADGGV